MSLDVQGPKTIRQMNQEFMDKYQLEVSMIISGTTTLWNQMSDDNKDRLDVEVSEIYKRVHKVDSFYEGKKYLVFVLGAEQDGVDADSPVVRYILN